MCVCGVCVCMHARVAGLRHKVWHDISGAQNKTHSIARNFLEVESVSKLSTQVLSSQQCFEYCFEYAGVSCVCTSAAGLNDG